MVAFNEALAAAVVSERSFGRAGAPWEFNLRDVLRWCELSEAAAAVDGGADAREAALPSAAAALSPVIYMHRLRTDEDRAAAAALFAVHFPGAPAAHPLAMPQLRLCDQEMQTGVATLARAGAAAPSPPACVARLALLRGQVPALSAASAALSRGWMVSLVGPAACGKTTLARSLATLVGATLHEVRPPLASHPGGGQRGGAGGDDHKTHSALSDTGASLRGSSEESVLFPIPLPAPARPRTCSARALLTQPAGSAHFCNRHG